jgi:hypothetical protein
MSETRGWGTGVAAIAAAALIVWGCGPRNLRQQLLASGAINVGEAIEEAMGSPVSVIDASFSPDSGKILVQVISLTTATVSLWVYNIEDGSLVETALRSGWVLSTAAFAGTTESLLLAVERPDPPSFKIYQTRVGSTEWANLTDLIPTSFVKTVQLSQSPDQETLAVVSASEGHTDLTVSRGGHLLLETQVYPGYIKILGWNILGDELFVESDMPLHLGLTLEARLKNAAWDESMRQGVDVATYVLYPATGEVRISTETEAPDPMISPSGSYKLHLLAIDDQYSGLFLTHR